MNPNSTPMLSRLELHVSFKATESEMTRSQKEKDADLLRLFMGAPRIERGTFRIISLSTDSQLSYAPLLIGVT
jgi:hypothetical protein